MVFVLRRSALRKDQVLATRQDRTREEAALISDEGAIDRLELRYLQAAEKYGEAADLMRFDPGAHWGYLLSQASALRSAGEEFGDNQALQSALGVYASALSMCRRTETPLDWAATQNNLGNTLLKLRERESGTERLEEAVEAYRAALEVFSSAGSECYARVVWADFVIAHELLDRRRMGPG